nr:immunoglobulin heavy chain junction region [Mus musculus]MBK4186440.1 immunoglobulin heavy chain junction region [Mus musculus]NSM07429.1 immunoglobulin heavy chain junction region [Mus musculus]
CMRYSNYWYFDVW